MLRGTAQGILLVVVRGADDILRTVKFPIVLVSGFKRNLFSGSAAAKKGVKAVFERNGSSLNEKNGSSLNLRAFSVQLT